MVRAVFLPQQHVSSKLGDGILTHRLHRHASAACRSELGNETGNLVARAVSFVFSVDHYTLRRCLCVSFLRRVFVFPSRRGGSFPCTTGRVGAGRQQAIETLYRLSCPAAQSNAAVVRKQLRGSCAECGPVGHVIQRQLLQLFCFDIAILVVVPAHSCFRRARRTSDRLILCIGLRRWHADTKRLSLISTFDGRCRATAPL